MALRQAPCIYTFCGGNCALFSANGYRLLLNGGDDDESVFWRYITHVPRLDAILATHASANTLPGLKSLFERKLAEVAHYDASHIRGSPDIGNIFINYPGAGTGDRYDHK